MRLSRLIFVALTGFALIAAACGGGNDDDKADDSDVTAATVLSSASDRWSETETVHFKLAVDGDAYIDSGKTIKLLSAEGDMKRPDSVKADAKIDVQISQVNISLIAIGTDAWMTNFITGAWEKAPSDFTYNPAVLFDKDNGIGPILANLQNAELDGTEKVNDRDAYKVNGSVDEATVALVTAGSIQGQQIDVQLWVDKETSDLLRVKLEEPEGVRDNPVTWTLDLTKQGEDVTIEAPAS